MTSLPDLFSSSQQFILSEGEHKRAMQWPARTFTLAELDQEFRFHRETSDKDGAAFIAGEVHNAVRKATAVKSVFFAVFDVDGAQSLAEVVECVEASGCFAWVYTTHSHGAQTTKVKTDDFARWAKLNNVPEIPDEQTLRRFLVQKGHGHLVVEKIENYHAQDEDGFHIVVKHAPVDKVRVIFPLAKPFVMADAGYQSKEAINVWKETYVGIGQKLGLKYDPKCVDPGRLYYFPSHPPKPLAKFTAKYFNAEAGKLLNYEDFERGEIVDNRLAAVMTPTVRDDGSVFSVAGWMQSAGRGSGPGLLDALRANHGTDDDFWRGPRPGKKGEHIRCPYEDEHSSSGGQGTFIDPGETENDFPKIYCSHAHCDTRKTEDFISGLLADGGLTIVDLTTIQKERVQKTMAARGIDMSAIPTADEVDKARRIALEDRPEEEEDVPDDSAPAAPFDTQDISEITDNLTSLAAMAHPLPQEEFELLSATPFFSNVVKIISDYVAKQAPDSKPQVSLIMFGMAVSGMTMDAVNTAYLKVVDKNLISRAEFRETVLKIRKVRRPLENEIARMSDEGLKNAELTLRFAELSKHYDVSAANIRRMFSAHQQSQGGATSGKLGEMCEAWSKKYAKLVLPQDTYFLDMDLIRAGEVDSRYTKQGLQKLYSNENVKTTIQSDQGGAKLVNAFDYWYEQWPDHTILRKLEFDPSKPPDLYEPGKFNMYMGLNHVKPIAGDPGLLLDHIRTVWCGGSDELFGWLMMFFANIAQDPGKRYASAVAIVGGQGTGKSIVMEHAIVPCFKPYSFYSTRREDLSGKFNAAVKHKLLFVAEEALFAGDHDTANKLKALISNDTISVEEKHMNAAETQNFSRYVFVSNETHVLKIERDDRRFLILRAGSEHQRDTAYFQKMRSWLDDKGRNHLFHYLLNFKPSDYKLKWDDLYSPPQSVEKTQQILMSVNFVHGVILELLIDGYPDVAESIRPSTAKFHWSLDGESSIPLEDWEHAIRARIEFEEKSKAHYHKTKFRQEFKIATGIDYNVKYATRVEENGKRRNMLVLPPRRPLVEKMFAANSIDRFHFDRAVSSDPTQEENIK